MKNKKHNYGISKKEAQIRHAKRRGKQRFNWDLSDEEYRQIVLDIQGGGGTLISKRGKKSLFEYYLYGIRCKIVYDRRRHVIVSFIPYGKEMHEDKITIVKFDIKNFYDDYLKGPNTKQEE